MMIRKRAVDFAIELAYFASQATIQLGRERTGHTVAAVDDDVERAGELHVRDDTRQVSLGDIGLAEAAAAGGKSIGFDALA